MDQVLRRAHRDRGEGRRDLRQGRARVHRAGREGQGGQARHRAPRHDVLRPVVHARRRQLRRHPAEGRGRHLPLGRHRGDRQHLPRPGDRPRQGRARPDVAGHREHVADPRRCGAGRPAVREAHRGPERERVVRQQGARPRRRQRLLRARGGPARSHPRRPDRDPPPRAGPRSRVHVLPAAHQVNGPLDTRAGAARRRAGVLIALAVLTVAGLGLAVTVGSTPLPLGAVAAAVARDGDPGVETIVWTVRLPRAVTALVAGAALGAAGLQRQTLFRNPLAEPYILGVSSGASLGVALVVTGVGGAGGMFTAGVAGFGRIGIVLAATAGAAAVLVLVLLLSRRVRSLSTLLVIGVLIGAATVSLISLMLTYTDPRLAQQYLAWGLGSFAGTTWDDLAVFVPVSAGALAAALAGVKPLNALLLGERYARTMG